MTELDYAAREAGQLTWVPKTLRRISKSGITANFHKWIEVENEDYNEDGTKRYYTGTAALVELDNGIIQQWSLPGLKFINNQPKPEPNGDGC